MARPLFGDRTVPRTLALADFQLDVLVIEDVDIDYQAVTESTADLAGLFGGDWPVGLTLRENLVDLGWHEREFGRGTSFAWVIRDSDGRYCGCAYLRAGEDDEILAHSWFRSSFDDLAAIEAFDAAWRTFAGSLSDAPVVHARRSRFHPLG